MTLNLPKRSSQYALLAVEGAAFLLLSIWTARVALATLISRTPSIKNFQLAIRLDPGEGNYPLALGRLYEYSPTHFNSELAIADLRHATEIDPYNPDAWLALGGALEFLGRIPEAETCLKRASALAPNLPDYQWTIGNFYLLHGDLQNAFSHLKIVLAGSTQYEKAIYTIAWKASQSGQEILDWLIPNKVSAEFSYLDYLDSKRQLNDAAELWTRIIKSPQTFRPKMAAGYFDTLIEAHQPAQASSVWNEVISRGLLPPTCRPTPQNLIVNGSFEQQPLGWGFGWRVENVNDVYVNLDETEFHSAGHSLLIDFLGKQNLFYRNVYQLVNVEPNKNYVLRAYIKTDGITTDSGPRIDIHDAYNSSLLSEMTDSITGSSVSWTPLTLRFRTSPQTTLVTIGIIRPPSQQIENKITGKIWIDDVTLTPES